MKKTAFIICFILLSAIGLFFYQCLKFNDGLLHVIFCDVGQGDAVLIRTPDGSIMLYDGGPDYRVLDCLRDYTPLWKRSIDLMILSHPHADHLIGLTSVLKRYRVHTFKTENLRNDTAMFTGFIDLLKKQKTAAGFLLAGDSIMTADGLRILILGPSNDYLLKTSPGGMIGESKEFASLVLLLSYKDFDVLLTGDSQAEGLTDAGVGRGILPSLDVLQVPHHGSKTGLNRQHLSFLNPKLAVVSVGKNNYGHPNKTILQMLLKQGTRVVRTDMNGSIEIVSDGKKWWVRNNIDKR